MAIVKTKPTSPGRRFVVKVVNNELHKGAPERSLTESKNRNGGRNNAGRISVRHQGGGHKQRYRLIDFKRDKDGISAVSSVSNTIQIAAHILHCWFIVMANVTSSRLKE